MVSMDFSFNNCGYAETDVQFSNAMSAWLENDEEAFRRCFRVKRIFTVHPKQPETARNKTDLFVKQCGSMYKTLSNLIAMSNTAYMFAELPYGSKSQKASKALGAVAGMYAALCVNTPCARDTVTPAKVKKAAGGNSKSSKQFMMDWARSNWPNLAWNNNNSDEHMADAIACGLAGMILVAERHFEQ